MSRVSLTDIVSGVVVEPQLNEADGLTLAFSDNRLLAELLGEHDEHLALIASKTGVEITPRGNRLAIIGPAAATLRVSEILSHLYDRAAKGHDITAGDVRGAISVSSAPAPVPIEEPENVEIKTKRRLIQPRSPGQVHYLKALCQDELVFGIGPAGTGKTYLAVAAAAAALVDGRVDRIILSRPAVEAGERLGFLPGDMKEKVDPYLRPLYDALYDMLPATMVTRGLNDGTIEIAPLAFMRGRTLGAAFIILDEAQNTTDQQMKMFLTRLGEGSRMVITGDPTQVDLPIGITSGLSEAVRLLVNVDGISQIRLTASDIVRHPLVTKIVNAYEADHNKSRNQ